MLDKVPELDPREIDDLMLGCAQPAGEAGYNIARAVAVGLSAQRHRHGGQRLPVE